MILSLRLKCLTYFGLSMLIKKNTFMPLESNLSPLLFRWLNHKDSLTANLKVLAKNVNLQVLNQGWKGSSWCDKEVLSMQGIKLFIREILMSADGEPCWYARTIIPDTTYNSSTFFNRLYKEALTALIFNEPKIMRIELKIYAISNKSLEYYWLPEGLRNNQSIYWVRISYFLFEDKFPFYLIEILLPALERYEF